MRTVITNSKNATPEDLLERYRGLWEIEAAFRLCKHDLKMRPIFHWNPERIKAHVAICFTAYALAKQATYRIAIQQEPISFEQLRNELLHVQATIILDKTTGRKYVMPSNHTVKQKRIYQTLGLKRQDNTYRIK